MVSGEIPRDLDELIAQYGPFIYHVIRKVVPRIAPEDLEDLHADVLHRLLDRDYLQRCREYAEGREGYNFCSSLRALTERTSKNFLRYRAAKRRGATTVSLSEVLQRKPMLGHAAADDRFATHTATGRALQQALADTHTARDTITRIDFRTRIDKLRAHLHRRNRVIGGLPATQVLDQMLDGADLSRYERSRLQVYARQQEAEWQRVG